MAEACLEIQKNAADASRYTARGNLVAVVSNGTAVLGLGNIGALASKPVMEGKAVLFKKFANIDCFDLEVDETDPEKLADIVSALGPTFGAINLEDIKAPDCFVVEKLCRERMNIPVFHDDQHGTAIVVSAAATNALRIAKKDFKNLRKTQKTRETILMGDKRKYLQSGTVDVEREHYIGQREIQEQFKGEVMLFDWGSLRGVRESLKTTAFSTGLISLAVDITGCLTISTNQLERIRGAF